MAFDARAFAGAHTVWHFTDLAGRDHPARELSAPEALQWFERFRWAGNDQVKQQSVVSRLWRRLFPWSWRYLVPAWLGGRPDPWRVMMRLPGPAQAEALQSFFGHAGLVTPTPRTPTQATS